MAARHDALEEGSRADAPAGADADALPAAAPADAEDAAAEALRPVRRRGGLGPRRGPPRGGAREAGTGVFIERL